MLPAAALLFLGVGALAWASGFPADRIWLAGLILTGLPVVWDMAREAARGHFATDLVAALAIVGALLVGEPLAGLVIVLMRSGGEALDRFAEGRASAAVRELEAAAPRVAHRMIDGDTQDVPVEAIAPGDRLLVRPGELVPCDSVVLAGRSPVDASRLTGEPLPIDAQPGVALLSGSVNGTAPLTVRAAATAGESAYARIVQLVRSAQATKAPIQRIADRYAVWFTPLTLLVCGITAWITRDATRVLAVLVVATPCPLILATPIAIIGGLNRAARRWIVIRNGGALEQLAKASVIVLDKTGTLTVGRPEVTRVSPAPGWSEAEVLRFAGGVEQAAGHLLARSVVETAQRALLPGERLPEVDDALEAPGRGITGTVAGRRVTVGSPSFVAEREGLDPAAGAARSDHGLRALVAIEGRLAGTIEFADRIRDDAHGVIDALRELGVRRVVLLSGDAAANVEWVAGTLGLSDARGELLPEDKVSAVRELMASGEVVVMVGDGTNDAPAMSSATVGVALAAHGGGITAEAADVVVLADDLARLPEVIRIGRRTMHIARQSLIAGLGLSGVAMVVAAFGGFSPTIGALLQEGIDVAVILNALRTSR